MGLGFRVPRYTSSICTCPFFLGEGGEGGGVSPY